MRDADLLLRPSSGAPGFHTLLVVTRLGDVALATLLAGADAAATVCTPADAIGILQHVTVDIVMILDDVTPLDRTRIDVVAAGAQVVAGSSATTAAPRSDRCPAELPAFAFALAA